MGVIGGCGGKTVKYLVFFFNFLVFIAGIAILAGSVAAYVSDPVEKYFMKDANVKEVIGDDDKKLRNVLVVGMILGGILLLLGFLGCCGAIMENTILLGTFVAIMIILLIAQIAIAIAVLVHKGKMKEQITKALDKAYEKKSDCETFWKTLQDNVKCCGRVGKQIDYCAAVNKGACPAGNTKGCIEEVNTLVKNHAKVAGIIMLIFVVLEIAAVAMALWLCCEIRKQRNNYD